MSVTDSIKSKRLELEGLVTQAKTLHDSNVAKGAALTQEDANQLISVITAGQTLRQELDALLLLEKNDTFLHAVDTAGGKAQQRTGHARKSALWGDLVLEAPIFEQARQTGRPVQDLPRIDVGGFKHLIGREGRQTKAIYSALATAGGDAIFPDFRPEILDIARQQPPSVIDLVNRSTTNSDLVEYVLMDTRTSNAAVVTEYSAGSFGLKPESNRTFDLKTAAVKTIAAWIGASRQVLNDAPRLRALIDNELTYEVELALEANLITDVLAWSGIQTRVHATSGARWDSGDNDADTLERALTDVELAFYRPDGIVVNPAQGETLELMKDDNGAYLHVYDSATMRLWRVPVLETPAMTAGTALVGAFKMGVTVWDREQTQVLTGQPNDYFLRNAFAILAELRAAWAVTRPLALEKVTGLV